MDSFWIARFPVTNAEDGQFVAAGGYVTPAWWDPEGWAWVQEGGVREPDSRSHGAAPQRARHPVVGVTWWEAMAYARWAGHRLPTADEWEKAARGTDGRVWPWGDAWDPSKLNSREQGRQETTPVGSFPAGRSPYGCDDMAGNVDEWTTDPRHADTRGLKRGGTWNTPGWHCRCSHRCGSRKDHRNPTIGFRCGHDAAPVGAERAVPAGTPV